MAEKVQRKPKGAPVKGASASPPSSEMSILHPERTFTLAGRGISVREYGHFEGLQLLAWAKPFTDDLYQFVARGAEAPNLASMLKLHATHARLVQRMVAQSITPPLDDDLQFELAVAESLAWTRKLGDIEGDVLVMTWWQVNSGFFIRRLLAQAAAERVEESLRRGLSSTTPSSAPVTDETHGTSAG